MHEEEQQGPPPLRRVIKRYSNRKLYDTRDSRYVTLLQIAELVRAGEDVQILDNATKEDKTDVTLALIISEELKARPRGIPLATLKALIRHRGERLLTSLRDGPIGKLMPAAGQEPPQPPAPEVAAVDSDPQESRDQQSSLKRTLDQWQASIDARISAILPAFTALGDLQRQIKSISERLDDLERRLADRDGNEPPRE